MSSASQTVSETWTWMLSRSDLSSDVKQLISKASEYPELRALAPVLSLEKRLTFSETPTYPFILRGGFIWSKGAGNFEVRALDQEPIFSGEADAALRVILQRLDERQDDKA
jgi:hypothetical protein